MPIVNSRPKWVPTDIENIMNQRWDVKNFFHELFTLLIAEDMKNSIPHNLVVEDALITKDSIDQYLEKDYTGKEYVILFYAQEPHSTLVSPYFSGDKRAHTSIFIGKVEHGKISNLVNIDGYDNSTYVDIQREPWIAGRMTGRLVVKDRTGALQAPSWDNMNCVLYAFTFVQTILEMMQDPKNAQLIDNIFSITNQTVMLSSLQTTLLAALARKQIYIHERNGVYTRNQDLTIHHHNVIRQRLNTYIQSLTTLNEEQPTMTWNYQPYDDLSQQEKTRLAGEYRREFRDFDNDIIVNSASEVLNANGITDFHAFQVGPDTAGEDFELAWQLPSKLKKEKRYNFFSLPTLGGNHSVGVVIDTKTKCCYVIDSLAQCYGQAIAQLQDAIYYGILPEYRIVTPDQSIRQQRDNWSCGIHTAANIVGIITGSIDVNTNRGVAPRTDKERDGLLGLFVKANSAMAAKRGNALNEPRLYARQKKALRSALRQISGNQDVQTLIESLNSEVPNGMSDDETQRQRSFDAFCVEFITRYPNNCLNSYLRSPELIALLPATMQDNVGEKELAILSFLQRKLSTTTSSSVTVDPIKQDATMDEVKTADIPEQTASSPMTSTPNAAPLTPSVIEIQASVVTLPSSQAPVVDIYADNSTDTMTQSNPAIATYLLRDALIGKINEYLSWRETKIDSRPYTMGFFTHLRHYTQFGKTRAETLKNSLQGQHGVRDLISILSTHFMDHSRLHNHSLDTYLLEAIENNKGSLGLANHFNANTSSGRSLLRDSVIALENTPGQTHLNV